MFPLRREKETLKAVDKLSFYKTKVRLACTQAVGWSKKPEFVMRSPSWIRAARSGPG